MLAGEKDNQNRFYSGSKTVKQIKVDSAIAHGEYKQIKHLYGRNSVGNLSQEIKGLYGTPK